jgi:hypothetical protein
LNDQWVRAHGGDFGRAEARLESLFGEHAMIDAVKNGATDPLIDDRR